MLKLKNATDADATAIALLTRKCFEKQARLLGISLSDCPSYVAFETTSRVRQRIANGAQIALAYLGDEMVGTISYLFRAGSIATGEIARLAVAPPYRGNHYGRVLIEHAESRLIAAGALVAEISIVARFRRLRAYYEDLGYSEKAFKRVPRPRRNFQVRDPDPPRGSKSFVALMALAPESEGRSGNLASLGFCS